MGRRISSSRSRGFSGGGFKASSFRSSGFKPSSSRYSGGYNYRSRPYRRNYFYHKLSPVGKILYILGLFTLYILLSFL
jgi:hypothetical protein